MIHDLRKSTDRISEGLRAQSQRRFQEFAARNKLLHHRFCGQSDHVSVRVPAKFNAFLCPSQQRTLSKYFESRSPHLYVPTIETPDLNDRIPDSTVKAIKKTSRATSNANKGAVE